MHLDTSLFFWINDLAGRWWLVDEWWRFWANDYVVPSLLVGTLAVGWFTGEGRWRVGLLCALVALALANILVAGSNAIWFRPRPFTTHEVNLLFYYPSDSSFPSNSAAVVWSLAWVIWRVERGKEKGERREGYWGLNIGKTALGMALLMGVARIWVGIHYPLDIIGGAIIGILAGELVWRGRLRMGRGVDGLVRLARLLKLD
jgi:undecaprenyl-diphosphatase